MTTAILLVYSMVLPLLALGLIMRGRTNEGLTLQLCAGTGSLFAVLTWLLSFRGSVLSVLSANVWMLAFEEACSQLAIGLSSVAWIIALFLAVQARAQLWIVLLVISGILSSAARLVHDFPGTGLPLIFAVNAYEIVAIGLYALGFLGGLMAFAYGSVLLSSQPDTAAGQDRWPNRRDRIPVTVHTVVSCESKL